jgi:hypothetical protein
MKALRATSIVKHIFKISKRGLGCSSVVQSLPSMREALASIPAPKKKRQKKTSPQKRNTHIPPKAGQIVTNCKTGVKVA